MVVTNDGASAQSYTLRLRAPSAAVDAYVRTPPSGTRDAPITGSPAQADDAALRTLLSQASGDHHYRHYADTNTYVGISVSQQRLLDPDGHSGALQDLGALSAWLGTAGCR